MGSCHGEGDGRYVSCEKKQEDVYLEGEGELLPESTGTLAVDFSASCTMRNRRLLCINHSLEDILRVA